MLLLNVHAHILFHVWSQLLHLILGSKEDEKERDHIVRHGDISPPAATNRFTQSTVNYLHRPPPLQLFTRIAFTIQLLIKTKTEGFTGDHQHSQQFSMVATS